MPNVPKNLAEFKPLFGLSARDWEAVRHQGQR